MGDPVLAHDGHLAPQLVEERVGDPVVLEPVEPRALHELVHEEHRLVADTGDRPYPGRADAGVARQQRDEGFVLDASAQAEERAFVADVLQPDEAIGAEQEVGGALLRALDLRVQAGAVGAGDEVRAGAPAEIRVAGETRARHAGGLQRGAHRGERRALVGAPVHQEHETPCGRTDRDGGEERSRHPVGDGELEHGDRRADEQPGTAPPVTDEGAEDHERGHQLRHRDRRRDREVGSAVDRDPARGGVARGVVQPVDRTGHEEAAQEPAREQVAEEAVSLGEERRQEHREGDEPERELAGAVDEALGGGRHELEEAEQVLLDAEQPVARPARQGEEQDGDQCEREEAEDVARGSDVADDLLGFLDRRDGRRDGVIRLGDRDRHRGTLAPVPARGQAPRPSARRDLP